MFNIDPAFITSAESVDFWAITSVILAVGLIGLYGFATYFKQVRLIEDTPTSKIRSAAQGFVELEGMSKKP